MKPTSFLERAMKAERELETEKNNRNHLIEKGAGLERKLAALTAERDQLRLDCDNESKWAAHYLELFIANRDRADKAEEQFRILKKTFDHVTKLFSLAEKVLQ
jgi:hypothetical protein